MDPHLIYQVQQPHLDLQDYVECFWMLRNDAETDKPVVILPDGRVDVFFSKSTIENFHVTLLGIGTSPERTTIAARSVTFAISFKLPGVECILKTSIAHLINKGEKQPNDLWTFHENDLLDFDEFCQKATRQLLHSLSRQNDPRKIKLFDLIYANHGSLSVKELSERVYWSSRQMNRYFLQMFGLPLKPYCNILRFRASLQHIKRGKLFPEENFTDQSHFIREIKKRSGVLPKTLNQNQNDRFIQFSTMPEK